jgi:hypothetical protein
MFAALPGAAVNLSLRVAEVELGRDGLPEFVRLALALVLNIARLSDLRKASGLLGRPSEFATRSAKSLWNFRRGRSCRLFLHSLGKALLNGHGAVGLGFGRARLNQRRCLSLIVVIVFLFAN